MSDNYKKRHQYVVDRKFQFKFIANFLFAILGALAIFTVAMIVYFWVSSMAGDNIFKEYITIDKQITVKEEVQTENGLETVERTETKTIHGLKRWDIVIPPIIFNNLVIMVVVGILGFLYSHRIAGPTYRIMTDIQKALDGDASIRINLREKDQLTDLADAVNSLLEEFEKLKSS